MSDTTPDRYRGRARRRLRYRSRSVAASIALIVTALAAAYVGVEAALALLGQPPLVSAPFGLLPLVQQIPAVAIAVAAVLAMLGLICIIAAITPGRFRRRVIEDDRALVVIDDDVVASGVSRAVSGALGIGRTQVRTSLGRRRADVRVTPTTGFAASAEPAREAGGRLLADLRLSPAPTVRADIERTGVIA